MLVIKSGENINKEKINKDRASAPNRFDLYIKILPCSITRKHALGEVFIVLYGEFSSRMTRSGLLASKLAFGLPLVIVRYWA